MAFKVWNDSVTPVPTVYLHSFVGDGESVWQACHAMKCAPFNLVSIHDIDLDAALTPWVTDGVRKEQPPFGGKSQEHLEYLLNEVMKDVEHKLPASSTYNIIAGYSLAGMFALWSTFQTEIFRRVATVSGSLWYPGFANYLHQTPLDKSPECIYFSLGNKESTTRHPLMQQVEEITHDVVDEITRRGIPTVFEMNPGNHFTDPDRPMAKAIKWILEQ